MIRIFRDIDKWDKLSQILIGFSKRKLSIMVKRTLEQRRGRGKRPRRRLEGIGGDEGMEVRKERREEETEEERKERE